MNFNLLVLIHGYRETQFSQIHFRHYDEGQAPNRNHYRGKSWGKRRKYPERIWKKKEIKLITLL